jgi:sugar/nucleoside kinase (ribokinase family)
MLLGLARGDDLVDAARLGAAAASIVVEGRGGATLGRIAEAWARRAHVD